MARFGFRNFCFFKRVVSEMIGAIYGLSRKLGVEFLCDIYKIWNFWTKSRFSKAKYGRIYG